MRLFSATVPRRASDRPWLRSVRSIIPIETICKGKVTKEMIANGGDMTVRAAGLNDHVVAQCRFSGNVDGDNVFRFGFLEAGEDQFQRMECSRAAFHCG